MLLGKKKWLQSFYGGKLTLNQLDGIFSRVNVTLTIPKRTFDVTLDIERCVKNVVTEYSRMAIFRHVDDNFNS